MNKLTDDQILALAANAHGCNLSADDIKSCEGDGSAAEFYASELLSFARSIESAILVANAPSSTDSEREELAVLLENQGRVEELRETACFMVDEDYYRAAALLREPAHAPAPSLPVMERSEWCETKLARTMVVCPKCGNKRCPHATDQNLPCTGSNDPGQPGSRYTITGAPTP